MMEIPRTTSSSKFDSRTDINSATLGIGLVVDDDSDDELVMTDHEPDIYYSPIFSPQALVQQRKFRVLGAFSLLGLTFFVVCGGPIGTEPLVSSGGPLLGFVGMAHYVLLCVFPFSWVLAELCSTFPDNGGYSVWILSAFGPFWGFQVGYWSWISSVLNNAIYPGIIFSAVCEAYGLDVGSSAAEYFIKVGIACVLALPPLLSVRLVGATTLALGIVMIGIVLLFSIYSFADGEHAWGQLVEIRESTSVDEDGHRGIDWVLLVNTLFWNFDGLYDISVIAGEVHNPGRAYPRVIFGTVSLAFATYTLPLIAAVSGDRFPWLGYTEDSYPSIAKAIGGEFLHQLMLASTTLGSIGLFTGSVFFQSFQVLGMAQAKLLPEAFRHRHEQLQTPQYAVILSLLATTLLLAFDFEKILSMTNALSAGIQVFIVCAMLRLRQKLPYVPRPTKVPGSHLLLCGVLFPTTGVFLYILFTTLFDPVSALVLCVLVVPGVIYGILRRRREKRQERERAARHQQFLLQQSHPVIMPRGTMESHDSIVDELRIAMDSRMARPGR